MFGFFKKSKKEYISSDNQKLRELFTVLGIDINQFPNINTTHLIPTDRYSCNFSDINIKITNKNESLEYIVEGFYYFQASVSVEISEGEWRPGNLCVHKFRFANKNLEIIKK